MATHQCIDDDLYKLGHLRSVPDVKPHWLPSILALFIHPPIFIYPSLANQHNVLHISLYLCSACQKCGVIKPRGEPDSAPTLANPTALVGRNTYHHGTFAPPDRCTVPPRSPVVVGGKQRPRSATCTEGVWADLGD